MLVFQAEAKHAGGGTVSDLIPQLRDYRLTTAEIIYHLPDHPDLLQSFIWQHLDIAPDYPNLRRFLDFWQKNIEGMLHSGTARLGGGCPRGRAPAPAVLNFACRLPPRGDKGRNGGASGAALRRPGLPAPRPALTLPARRWRCRNPAHFSPRRRRFRRRARTPPRPRSPCGFLPAAR